MVDLKIFRQIESRNKVLNLLETIQPDLEQVKHIIRDSFVRYEIKSWLVKFLTDQDILEALILDNDTPYSLRVEIAPRIFDQQCLLETINVADDYDLRYFVSQYITDIELLDYLIHNGSHQDVRHLAIQKIAEDDPNHPALRHAAFNDSVFSNRALAASYIPNQDDLRKLYDSDHSIVVKAAVLARLDDRSFLEQEYQKLEDTELRMEIIKNLGDVDRAKDILYSDKHDNYRLQAMIFINQQSVYKKIARSDNNYMRWYAVEQINDETFLRNLVVQLDSNKKVLIQKIIDMISDKKLLKSLMLVTGARQYAKLRLKQLD